MISYYDICNCSCIKFYSQKTRVNSLMIPADLSHDFSKPLEIYSEDLDLTLR